MKRCAQRTWKRFVSSTVSGGLWSYPIGRQPRWYECVRRKWKFAYNTESFILIMQKPPRFKPEGILFALPPDLTYTFPDAPWLCNITYRRKHRFSNKSLITRNYSNRSSESLVRRKLASCNCALYSSEVRFPSYYFLITCFNSKGKHLDVNENTCMSETFTSLKSLLKNDVMSKTLIGPAVHLLFRQDPCSAE